MKKVFTFFAFLVVLFVSACSQPDAKIEAFKSAVDVAEYQLLYNAREFDTTQLAPRSWKEGEYRKVDPYDWTSGFFPGSLWLAYELTGNEALRTEAEKYTARLSEIPSYKGTHDLGFMVFCSYGRQQLNLKDSVSAAAIVEASESLISRCRDSVGLIRSWDFGHWNYPVIIDNMMNLEMLFWASEHTGDSRYRDVAVRHADLTLENHFREDNSSYHVVSYNDDGSVELKGTFQGFSDDSSWARGQAWGLYGYTMCYRCTGEERYLEHACKIAELVLNHPNTPEDLVPWWDYNAPDIPNAPRDTSAAAIMASALLELSIMVEGELSQRYFERAEKLLVALSSPSYLAQKGENGGFILMHATGHLPAHSEIDVPLNYGDYYFLEALQRYFKLKGIDYKSLNC